MKRFLALATLLAICSSSRAGLTKDIEYGRVGDASLLLDAFVPDGPGPFPAVIMVHGGGFDHGDKSGGPKKGWMAPMNDPLAQAGFAWFEINYRQLPKYPHPACIDDVHTAVRWVRAHAAEYHVDASRIVLAGESSGGEIVDLAAVHADESARVNAVVSFYGVYDVVAQVKAKGLDGDVGRFFGISRFDDTTAPILWAASAAAYLRPGLPPFLLVHGDADKTVPYQQDVDFRAKLLSLGVPCDLITIKGGGHGMLGWEKIAPGFKDEVVSWLQRTLPARPSRFVISDRGAVGDGATVNTRAIQGTIDACAEAGGGVVVVPPGVFVSGALYFKPGVNLELQKNAVLKSTTVMADFPPLYTSWEGVERYWTSAFLNFIGMKDVTVSGEGTIDGSGLAWPGAPRGPRPPGPRRPPPPAEPDGPLPDPAAFYPAPRPTTSVLALAPDPAHLPPINAAGIRLPGGGGRLSPPRALVFQDCTNVRVSGVHLLNQARWGFVFIYCQDVVAENLTDRTEHYIPSSDGIDLCSCAGVRISHCDITCNDDDISIKAGKDADGLRLNRPSEHITISDCTFGSGGGVAMGSEVSGSIRHVLVERCRFVGSGTAARIKSQPSRGGVVEDIVFRDIQVAEVSRAIEFDVEWRMVPPLAPAAKVLTVVRNIRLINFTGNAQSVGVIRGFEESPIEDLKFEHCSLTAKRGLMLAHVAAPDLSGLALQVTDGEPIIHPGAATAP
jgi:acetyl esterase/lipase